jgi:type II secretory pathway pseudopilin PulG
MSGRTRATIPGRNGQNLCPPGFTIAETVAALGILAVAMILVAQIGVWTLQEGSRSSARQAAQELAANVLEAARGCPWDALGPDWASSQKLPQAFNRDGWKVKVEVAPEKSRPYTKRVTVQVKWTPDPGPLRHEEELVGWFSARSAPATGAKP